ncbi:AAA family ATPase [Rhizobium phaseoli]|uniref:AAA family ATPase n=1 Tax=Rhizobium phaseoli TaxID=396 RepID=UPI0007EBE4DA|nr:AAA family ATPase [Rhizobium phaseoli]ANL41447.1 ATP-dependent peptidase M41 family protein [Rhizobium phaseoli]ANL60435.1 ATP-dependent peptidase M41 family protein [Rhizobium phaseoli]
MADSDQYLVEIRPRIASGRLRDIVGKSPGVFLLHAAFRRALRSQHRLRNGLPSLVIVIVDTEEIGDVYRKAAELALRARIEPWQHLRRQSQAVVHVLPQLSRKKSKSKTLSFLEEYGRFDSVLVLARNRSDLPEELAILADGVVDLEPPTADHINAARLFLGRQPLEEAVATAIGRLDLPLMVTLTTKARVSPEVVRKLNAANPAPATEAVPFLEELPGYGRAKEWGLAFVEDVRRFGCGEMDWGHLDRGVLLHGPPGTGKTLLAQALAKSAGLPLITASVSQWQSYGHLGDLLGAMRRTFETAQAQQPSIIFLDELDAIGDRTQFANNHANYSRQVVNYLLESIDGAGGRHQIVVIGATNFPEAIDDALLRSGRLERHIRIGLPNERERFDILQFHLKLTDDMAGLRDIAADLEGWNGADLEMIAREARRIGRRQSRPVQVADVASSLPPVQELSEESLRRIAVHEAGHAIVVHVLSPRAKISVAIRRQVRLLGSKARLRGGAVRYELPEDERSLDTRDQFESLICRLLAGAAAEEIVLGCRSSGFSGSKGSDLDEATVLATQMAASFGMGRSLPFLIESRQVTTESARRLPNALREDVSRILDQQYSRATAILIEHSALLDRVAAELFDRATLTAGDFDELIAGCAAAPRQAAPKVTAGVTQSPFSD